MRRTLPLLCCILLPLSGIAAERPTDERIEALVQDYANQINPTIDPTRLSFAIRRIPVPGLWEQLGAEVVDVNWLMDGQPFHGYVGIYHDDQLLVLAPSLGGRGFMSGLVSNGAFYFTFSWGTGTHRSHVAEARFVDGGMKLRDSGGFAKVDLFVSAAPDGAIRVEAGRFSAVNSWTESRELGTVRDESPARLGIVGPDGKPVPPDFPP